MSEDLIRKNKWLYPVSWLYGTAVTIRNKLFDWGILQSKSFNVPIICVGNLAVGGTGKTPHTEFLIKLLSAHYHVAVLSRGYKRHTKGYLLADAKSTAQTIGDEPYQIHQKYPNITLAVDEDRCHGIQQLLAIKQPKIDLILLDDAFQHRYVRAGLNILLTDYHRLFSDDALLPAGRLREPKSGKNRAHMVIVTKCPSDIKPIDYNIIAKRLDLYPYQALYFSTFQYGSLRPVFPSEHSKEKKLVTLIGADVLLVTGIVSPAPMLNELETYATKVDLLAFDDHHQFTESDLQQIEERFQQLNPNNRFIVTTEKDAARLVGHSQLKDELKPMLYSLPITIKILQKQQDKFNQHIIGYVRKNTRNGSLPQK